MPNLNKNQLLKVAQRRARHIERLLENEMLTKAEKKALKKAKAFWEGIPARLENPQELDLSIGNLTLYSRTTAAVLEGPTEKVGEVPIPLDSEGY